MYTEDNQLALRMEGLEKPRRKRGRPPKSKASPEIAVEALPAEPTESVDTQQNEEELEDGTRGRRRRRQVPSRLVFILMAVYGKSIWERSC
jgi:hypothetical protein